MQLSGKQIKYLRSLAHHKKPVVTIGAAGVSDAVISETTAALAAHELIKIKLPATDKKVTSEMLLTLCEKTQSARVQQIGRTGVIYHPAESPRIMLP